MDKPIPDTEIQHLIGILVVLLAVLFLFTAVAFSHQFSKELQYLNNEIRRTEGREREYWIKRKRKLWLSLIPFVKY